MADDNETASEGEPSNELYCTGDYCTGRIEAGIPEEGYPCCEWCAKECDPGAPEGFACTGDYRHVFCSTKCLEDFEGKGNIQWVYIPNTSSARVCRERLLN